MSNKEPDRTIRIDMKIIKLVLSGHTQQPNEVYCKKYLASTQTKAFIEIFESL